MLLPGCNVDLVLTVIARSRSRSTVHHRRASALCGSVVDQARMCSDRGYKYAGLRHLPLYMKAALLIDRAELADRVYALQGDLDVQNHEFMDVCVTGYNESGTSLVHCLSVFHRCPSPGQSGQP